MMLRRISERSRLLLPDVRGAVRSARRLVVGARGLSWWAAGGWLVERARRRPPQRENSAFCWSVADTDRSTLCWLHNYWSDAYGIDRLTFSVSLIDSEGTVLDRWELVLGPDATVVVDVRTECRRAGVGLPFEGHLLLVTRDERLVPGRPVQAFVEYVHDDGDTTGVHAQYGLMRSPVAQYIGGSRVDATRGSRSGVVVVNPYDGPSSPVSMRSVVEVLTVGGAVHRMALPPLAPRQSLRVYADEVVPELDRALAGEPGQIRVRVPSAASRALTFVERPDGALVVSHATIDRSFDQGRGVPAGWVDSAPLLSIPVFTGDRQETVLTLPNCWGPRLRERSVSIVVHDRAGVAVASAVVSVAPLASVDVPLGEIAAGALPDGVGHAEVVLVDSSPDEERPAVLDVVVGIHRGGRLVGESQVGSDYFNAPVPPGIRIPDIRRTRVFTRVRLDGPSTMLFLSNPVAPGGVEKFARPTVTLLDAEGRRLSDVQVDIAPHGLVAGTVRDLFGPQKVEWGALRVRDTERRLYGYHLGMVDNLGPVPFDHLVGG